MENNQRRDVNTSRKIEKKFTTRDGVAMAVGGVLVLSLWEGGKRIYRAVKKNKTEKEGQKVTDKAE